LVALSIGCLDAKAADCGGGEQRNPQFAIGLHGAVHSFPPQFEKFASHIEHEAIIHLLYCPA
jgi:hypothetical protein